MRIGRYLLIAVGILFLVEALRDRSVQRMLAGGIWVVLALGTIGLVCEAWYYRGQW